MEHSMMIYLGFSLGMLLLLVMFFLLGLTKMNMSSALVCCIAILIATLAFSLWYPQTTIEYKNGYNDYPDNTTYNSAKIIVEDSHIITTASWYCDGWEQSRTDKINKEIRTIISRKAAI